ncbi:orexin/Hypocretin receptor type 1-like isoform X2 [Harmonia axyridis]|uniref:orexin/Hypocretin receptor type 1-like isoform X2 n=1 Tax=Harmonia axyridis TaxID=115357 RepID=UPI001E277D96|nr:orexin/Hypocretin receptor type 1-like isoform X2 [Harmonia axyridis]
MRFKLGTLSLVWFLSRSIHAETILKAQHSSGDQESFTLKMTYPTEQQDLVVSSDYNLLLEDYLDTTLQDNEGMMDNNDTYDATYNNTYKLEEIEQYIFPKTWTWVLIFFHAMVFLVGIVGNFLVCVAVYRNHSMRTVTNYFIVNLAVADFLVILFCLPPTVVWDVTMTWFFGVVMCKTVLYFQSVSVTVSVLTLTFISIDRWYAICFPLKFKSTTGRAKTAIWIIWLLSLSTSLPEMIYSTTERVDLLGLDTIYFTRCKPSWSLEIDTYFTIVRMIFSYAFPLLFMSVAYLQIIKVLWKSGNIPHQVIDVSGRHVNSFAMNMNASTEGQLKSRKKAAKMLVVVVVMFAICYFPVHLLSLLRLTVDLRNSEANRAAAMISHWLCYANSAVNPIIYNFMSGKFRKEFRSSFSKCSSMDPPEGNGRTSTYIYRFTANRQSTRSRTEIIPLNNVHSKIN